MTTPTVPVTVNLAAMGGPALPGITVIATLDANEVYNGVVVAMKVSAKTDSSGVAVLNLFPNAPAPAGLGTLGTTYRITATIPGGRSLSVDARVPNSACRLENILVLEEVGPLSSAELALLQAQSSLSEVSANAAAADAARIAAQGAAGTATAKASEAAGYKADAAAAAAGALASASAAGASASAAAGSATAADAARVAAEAALAAGGAGIDPGSLADVTSLTGAERIAAKQGGNMRGLDVNVLKDYLLNGGKNAAFNLAQAINATFGTKYGYVGTLGVGGGAVVQANSKAQAVTLNCAAGQVTLNAASLAAGAQVAFILNNSYIAADDEVYVWKKGGGTAGAYSVQVDSVAAGSCTILVKNNTGGALGEALVIGFSVRSAAIFPVVGSGGGASMLLGMNVSSPYYTSGPLPFANLVWNADKWQDAGVVDFPYCTDQWQGLLSGRTSTQVSIAQIAGAAENLPPGTYTWRNPDGCNIGFGPDGANPSFTGYTTATSGTFTLTAGQGLALFAKGNVTNALGNIQCILPGHVASWDAGDYFNSAYIAFHQGLGTAFVRVMDWMGTNGQTAADWADRAVLTKPFMQPMAWEVCIALANKLNKPLWLNVPARATDAYVSSLASLLNSTYTPSVVYVEYTNESWNFFFAFTLRWVELLDFTKIPVTINPVTGLITKTAHGYPDNTPFRSFTTQANSLKNVNQALFWEAAWGATVYYSKSISANSFELWTGTGGTGTKLVTVANATDLLLVRLDEAGKTADLHGKHATRSKQIWDIMDGVLGSSRVKAVMGGHHANTSITTARMANPTVAARVNGYATAPYNDAIQAGGAIDRTSNTFTPKIWTTDRTGATAYFVVCTAGSTPTDGQIKAGSGGGIVAASTPWSQTYSGSSYTSGSACTVVNGTTYTVWFAFMDSKGFFWKWSQNVGAANVTDTVDVLDTFDNQMLRDIVNFDNPSAVDAGTNLYATSQEHLAIITAANPSCQLWAYEAGSHEDEAKPAAIGAWWELMQESPQYATVLSHATQQAAASGFRAYGIYRDIQTASPWTIADSTYDTADLRYQAMAAFAGAVPVRTLVNFSAVNAGAIPTAPGAFPSTFYTFANTGLSYQIVCGDDDRNYAVNGASLQIVAQNNINWAVITEHTLKMRATDGFTDAFFDLTFTTNSYPTSSFDPATLFASAQKGFWYDPADFSTLFQDTAGTVPVTAAGQSVGKMLDKSGNGAHIVFTINKPTLDLTAGAYSLVTDGGNKGGQTAANLDLSAFSQLTVCVGLRKASGADASSEAQALCFGDFSASGQRGFEISAPDLQSASGHKGFSVQLSTAVFAGVSTKYVSDVAAPITRVFTATLDRTQATVALQNVVRLNAVTQAGTTSGAAVSGSFTAGKVVLFVRDVGVNGNPFFGNFYGAICRAGANSGTDIANMENWVGARSGFSL